MLVLAVLEVLVVSSCLMNCLIFQDLIKGYQKEIKKRDEARMRSMLPSLAMTHLPQRNSKSGQAIEQLKSSVKA